jgi:hypothetical protein
MIDNMRALSQLPHQLVERIWASCPLQCCSLTDWKVTMVTQWVCPHPVDITQLFWVWVIWQLMGMDIFGCGVRITNTLPDGRYSAASPSICGCKSVDKRGMIPPFAGRNETSQAFFMRIAPRLVRTHTQRFKPGWVSSPLWVQATKPSLGSVGGCRPFHMCAFLCVCGHVCFSLLQFVTTTPLLSLDWDTVLVFPQNDACLCTDWEQERCLNFAMGLKMWT